MTVRTFRFQDLKIGQLAIEIADGLFIDNKFSKIIGVVAMRFALCAMRF
jgi:hypothetical protein